MELQQNPGISAELKRNPQQNQAETAGKHDKNPVSKIQSKKLGF